MKISKRQLIITSGPAKRLYNIKKGWHNRYLEIRRLEKE
jgi:hypothetical protein